MLYQIMALESRKKKKEQENLEEESTYNQILRDEITKQVKLSAALQKQYEGKISELQGTALGMCRSIEVERKKNDDLKALINHMESKSAVPRRHESQSVYLPESTQLAEGVEAIVKKQHKLQYDFDQVVQKHNESLAQINDIHDQVNAARAERVIYSGVFRNIERQIRLMEEQYKKLIIERVYVQKQKAKADQLYQKRLGQAQKKIKTQGEMLNISIKEDDKPEPKVDEGPSQPLVKLQKVKSYQSARRKDDSIADTRDTSSLQDSKQEQIALNLKLQSVHIDHIKSQTGLGKNVQDIKYYLQNIEKINLDLFGQLEILNNQIHEQTQKLKNVGKSKSIHQIQRLGVLTEEEIYRRQKHQRMKTTKQNLDGKIKKERQVLKNLWDQNKLNKLFKLTKINPCSDGTVCEENIVLVYKQIEEALHTLKCDQEVPVATTNCDPDSKEKTNSVINSASLSEYIEASDKQKQCQKLLLHKQFTEVCQKQLNRPPEKVVIAKVSNRKNKK